MTFYLLSPTLLIVFTRYGNRIISITIVMILIQTITTIIYISSHADNLLEALITAHRHPFFRSSPWILGLSFAFWYHASKDQPPVKISQKHTSFIWFLSMISMIIALQLQQRQNQEENNVNVTLLAIRESMFRKFWTFGVALQIYACIDGLGGTVNQILSWKYWQPLARLTNTWYMLQYPVKVIVRNTSRYPYYKLPLLVDIVNELGSMTVALLLSIPWSLLFELPFYGK